MRVGDIFEPVTAAPTLPDLNSRGLRRTASGLCLAVLCGIVLLGALSYASWWLPVETETAWQGYSALIYLLSIGGAACVYARLSRTPLRQDAPLPRLRAGGALFAILLGIAACLLANYPSVVASWLLEQVGLFEQVPPVELENSLACMVFSILSVAVVPAVTEELLFRRLLLQKLLPYGTGFALAASSLVFAIFHGDLTQAAFAFFCGLALGTIVLKTGRVWPAMVVHFLNNALSGFYDIVEFYGGYRLANRVYDVCVYAILIAAAISLAVWLLRRRDKPLSVFPAEQVPLARGGRWGAFLFNPGFLLLLALSVYEMVMVFT